MTQTSSVSPGLIDPVVVVGVVQVASKKCTVNVRPSRQRVAVGDEAEVLDRDVYGTLVPTRPPSICVAGVSDTAYGSAIGVMNGEPVVNGPSADMALTPSLTIDVTFFFRASAMLTPGSGAASMLPPAAKRRHRPRHDAAVDEAAVSGRHWNVVFAGTGSVIVDAVAAALPMFFSVSV